MRATSLTVLSLLAALGLGQGRAVYRQDNVRVQVLSDTLVRLELKGPRGFEDRETFMVQGRHWAGPSRWRKPRASSHGVTLQWKGFQATIQLPAFSLSDVTIETAVGTTAYRGPKTAPAPQFFPSPSGQWLAFAVADNPRIVPPPEGATPPPPGTDRESTSGWDTTNPSLDVYVFLNRGGGYKSFIKNYLDLTGRIELPPLFAFGLIDSRYFPYTQAKALETIDKYRDHGFPLDMFVLDTDWRVGASKGYGVNTKLWPDLAGFIKQAQSKGVRTMFNDHPEPQTSSALDPQETRYRWAGLTSILGLGADVWWYDRNWITRLHEPVPGLKPEIWGERVYHDVTQRFRPDQRPMIMSNVEGIDNGLRHAPPQPGFHRYPIYWTGDTTADWPYLKFGIANAVNGGVESLLPFMSEDLTGHVGKPTPEFYVRFMQFGCLSPITRIHCTKGETRFPWDFGPEAETIVREFVKLRYRLLPTIYTAARKAHDDGTPLLRRCDLEWPDEKGARDDQQYLLGDDILVAPVNVSKDGLPRAVPAVLLHTKAGSQGLDGEYFDNSETDGNPVLSRVDPNVDFDWGVRSPDPRLPSDRFSVRWKGIIGPMPETGDYVIGTRTDDGARLFIDGKIVVFKWTEQDNVTNVKSVHFEKGKSYDVELNYAELSGNASCHFVWIPPRQKRSIAQRTLWIPPGVWIDPMTNARFTGPKNLTIDVPLSKMPILVREGSLVFLDQVAESTSKISKRTLMLDIYPPGKNSAFERTVYEDDGISPQYLRGKAARTRVRVVRKGSKLTLDIGASAGSYQGMPAQRAWIVRVGVPEGVTVSNLKIDGSLVAAHLTALPQRSESTFVRTPFSLDSGPVFVVPQSDVRKRHHVELTLRQGARG